MKAKQDSPGVYIPPPLLYVLTFFAAVFLQRKFYIGDALFHSTWTKIIGVLFLLAALYFMVTSLATFIKSRNTVVLIKPAASLQTHGVYNISRNPMYVSLAFIYLGITCIIGNWWNIILFPFLIYIMEAYVIRSEERYLERAFGEEYNTYRKRVKRWL